MKRHPFFYSIIAVAIVFSSCKKEEEASTSETTSTTPKEIIMPRVQAIPAQNYTQQQVAQPVNPSQNQTAPQTVTPNPVVTKPGMNPPHGQAGHRCDIAVGAPLNSPVSKPKPGATITQQPTFTTSTTTNAQTTPAAATPAILNPNAAATTVTAPGMNPPHGQAGHDCAVAVGAPLSKK